ncbi:MAG: hypothetical protein ACTSYX_09910 [Candidatus Thorarchaeota archaeon]
MNPPIVKMKVNKQFVNLKCNLPYGLQVAEIVATIDDVYQFLYDLDSFLVGRHYPCLADLILANTFSGVLSEIIVRRLVQNSPSLVRNEQVGGYPDLLPVVCGYVVGAKEQKASEGIEVKTSRQSGGWQGHNPEGGWLMVFRYVLHGPNSFYGTKTVEFVEVLAAKLDPSDWSFSGRHRKSRRTITASITKSGMRKLRNNPVLRNPAYRVKPK